MQGITEYKTPQGVYILRVHFTADPDKRSPEFEAEARRGMSEQDFEREYNISFNSPRGKAWYESFQYNLHVAKEPLQHDPHRPIYVGIDYGLTPASIFAQTTAKGQLLLLYPELQSEDCGMLAHGKVLQSECRTWFPGCTFQYIGDPAGNQRSQTDEKSCNDILRDNFGIRVQPGPVSFVQRDEALRKLLTQLTPDGQPMILIDPRCSKWIIAGFRGGYQRKEVAGVYLEEPDKNMFSHIMDSIQYVAATIYKTESRITVDPGDHRRAGGLRGESTGQYGGYKRGR